MSGIALDGKLYVGSRHVGSATGYVSLFPVPWAPDPADFPCLRWAQETKGWLISSSAARRMFMSRAIRSTRRFEVARGRV